MAPIIEPAAADRQVADRQVAEAVAAEYESLSRACRADASRLERLLAPDFHEFGASGGEFGQAGTAELVARSTDPDGDPITVERMRGQLLADGLVMVKYTSETAEGTPTGPRYGVALRPVTGRFSTTRARSPTALRRGRSRPTANGVTWLDELDRKA
jgi:hypothetical protein